TISTPFPYTTLFRSNIRTPLFVCVCFWKNTPLKLWAGPMKQTLLSLSNLTKQFDGKKVLDSLDLDIFDGEFITLLGPSGCGKTRSEEHTSELQSREN